MREILELENKVLPYAWGSRTRIAELLGRPSPAAEPQAELWMGAHPKAPSNVRIGGKEKPLDQLIAERPAEILGEAQLARGGPRLPFLLKALAADRALSIQAHPDLAQAAAGFEREERLGIPLEAEERNYRDRCHKPEVLYAVEPFSILRGFRRQQEILDLAAPLDLEGLLPALGALRRGEEGEGLEEFFTATLTLEGEGRLRRLNRKVVARIAERGLAEHPVYRWVLRLADQFPDDRGVIAPLFLHVLRLEPGQAIFTGPGILHAYLEGFGVELMANSDNVLRGGLTTKHVDVGELKKILRFAPQAPEILAPVAGPNGEQRFVPPVDDFALTLVPLAGDRPILRKVAGVEILLVLQGKGRLDTAASGRKFRRGQAFLVPADAGEYVLEGEGKLFRAEPGGKKG
jgi:mannose-6-phosphate isomerase